MGRRSTSKPDPDPKAEATANTKPPVDEKPKPEEKPKADAKSGPRVFYSKYRGYRMFDLVQFVEGRVTVSDPALIARMEADPKFGVDFFAE